MPTASDGIPASTIRFMTLAWLNGVPSNSSRRSAWASNCTTPISPKTSRAALTGACVKLCSPPRVTRNLPRSMWALQAAWSSARPSPMSKASGRNGGSVAIPCT